MTARRSNGPGGIGFPSLSLMFLRNMKGKIKESVMTASDTLSLKGDSGVLEDKYIVSGVEHR